MKAITLTQPYATLVAIKAKRFETRSWSTRYTGPLAIHAGKGLGPVGGERGLRALCESEPFRGVLTQTGFADPRDLPRGVIVATCELVDCLETAGLSYAAMFDLTGTDAEREIHFGDYTPGRFAWALKNIAAIQPVAWRGALGLWSIDEDFAGSVQ
ncbi:MAG TPA: hypothetical protein VMS11_03375 [Solirubrobacterales bacterium]|nr:hypothetical protein [Solirubrobacterales bacterium]